MEISGTSLYEMNKNLIAQQKPLSKYDVHTKIHEACTQLIKNTNNHYYMLLSNEAHDYTTFVLSNPVDDIDEWRFEQDMFECLLNRGRIYSIEIDGADKVEIWIKNAADELIGYYFFPYDWGVIE